MPANRHAVLIEFVLAQAEKAPVSKRIQIYRALADLIGDEQESNELIAIANDLQRAEARSNQLLFQFKQTTE